MMKTSRVLSSSVRSLKRNKLRTFFMMLGTLIGVTALTVVVALGQGTQQAVLDHFQRMFSGSQIRLQAVAESQHGVNTSRSTTLTIADLEAIQSTIPAVVMFDPMQYQGSGDFVFNGESRRTAVRGHSERYPMTANRAVTRGAFLQSGMFAPRRAWHSWARRSSNGCSVTSIPSDKRSVSERFPLK